MMSPFIVDDRFDVFVRESHKFESFKGRLVSGHAFLIGPLRIKVIFFRRNLLLKEPFFSLIIGLINEKRDSSLSKGGFFGPKFNAIEYREGLPRLHKIPELGEDLNGFSFDSRTHMSQCVRVRFCLLYTS